MIVCAKCGNANEARDEFCGSCGAFLEWHGERVGEEPAPAPIPVVAAPVEKPGLIDRVRYVVGLDDAIPGQPPTAGAAAPLIQTPGLSGAAPPMGSYPPVTPQQVGPYPPVTSQPPAAGTTLAPEPPGGPYPPSGSYPASGPYPPSVAYAPASPPPVATPPGPPPALNLPPRPPSASVNPISPADPAIAARLPGQEYERPAAHRPDATDLAPADLYCGACGGGNVAGRRFCRRCGSSLADAVVVKVSWWRRLFGGGGQVTDDRPRKGLGAGERPDKWKKLSVPDQRSADGAGHSKPKRRWGMPRLPERLPLGRFVAVPMFLLAFVGMGIPAARDAVTKWGFGVFHSAKRIADPDYVPVTAKSATGPGKPNHPASYAIDKNVASYWAESLPGTGAGAQLSVSFSTPTDLAKVGFRNGATGKDFTAQPRLKIVEVSFFDKENVRVAKKQLTLADKEELQSFDLDGEQITAATVKIISVYAGQKGSDASVKEVVFFHVQ